MQFTGNIESVLYRGVSDSPTFEIVIFDGVRKIVAKWLGVREISGITLGRKIEIVGEIVQDKKNDVDIIFNPKYTILGV